MTQRRFPDTAYQGGTMLGAALAGVCLATIAFLTGVALLHKRPPPYIGIISYVIVPVPLLLGLLLIPIGMWRERRRLRAGKPASASVWVIDLHLPKHQAAIILFVGVTTVFLLFTAYGSYRTFQWTESVAFCGTTCHQVMAPEFTAYQHSPHARVRCVECHVGSGASWHIRAKLAGAHQVYAVATNTYPRPIPTPIDNLRPARDTCEQCHWPAHFSGDKQYVKTYFKSDEDNTRWTIALLMQIGGGSADRGPTGGIHWHMNLANEVTYVATDSQRQSIPWVKTRHKITGEETEFVSTETSESLENRHKLPSYTMDCIDCHNRPAHIYHPPTRIVDQSLALGRISTALPNIKAASVQALDGTYPSTAAAMERIPTTLRQFYQEQFPQVAAQQSDLIQAAAEELKLQYSRNVFPHMRVSWKAYPNNIGHMTDLGCFRCHDGKHVSATGKVISKDCNSCHTILYQGTDPTPTTLTVTGLEFEHPAEIGEMWKEMNCKDCHAGP
jgi:nitrate/TMAO reductase-like tetraheme cytochrome c subunit